MNESDENRIKLSWKIKYTNSLAFLMVFGLIMAIKMCFKDNYLEGLLFRKSTAGTIVWISLIVIYLAFSVMRIIISKNITPNISVYQLIIDSVYFFAWIFLFYSFVIYFFSMLASLRFFFNDMFSI